AVLRASDGPGSCPWAVPASGLDALDRARARGAEPRILWRGATPLLGNEATIYENGAVGGPAPPCTAPLEPPVAPPPPGLPPPPVLPATPVMNAQMIMPGVALDVVAKTIPVVISWSLVSAVEHFELQQSASGGPFTAVSLASPTATSATLNLQLTGVKTLPSYQFQVRACNGTLCSPWVLGAKVTVQTVDNTTATSFSGPWSGVNLAGAYNGSVHSASLSSPTRPTKATLGKPLTFTTATGSFTWIATLGPDRGLATVSIDGGVPVTVDLYSPTLQTARVVFARNDLGPGQHTVSIAVLQQRNPLSTGTRVDHDAFVALL